MRRSLLAFSLISLIALGLTAPGARAHAYEINVSRDPAVRDGEPSLAVNPKDPDNLVIGYMKAEGTSFGAGECAVATSFDKGVTWQSQVLPFTDSLYWICADPTVIFGANGTAYMAAIAFNPTFQIGRTLVTRSTDKGSNWTKPAEAIGGASLEKAIQEGGLAAIDGFDRPWLAFDPARGPQGTLYLTTMTIFSRPMGPLAHRYLVASQDDGQSWGPVRMVDSERYPAGHWATGTIAVAPGGTVAIAYTARQVPESAMRCPCTVMATTTDGGLSFSHQTVPFTDSMFGINPTEQDAPSVMGLLFGPVVAADPARPGRYAVAVAGWSGLAKYAVGQLPVADREKVQVQLFLTSDSGESWTGPSPLGENLDRDREHVWLAYSPQGVLGVIWRTHVGPCCLGSTEVWSVVSLDGGTMFKAPQKLSQALSSFTGGLGDDFQSVVLDDSFLHAAWGDRRMNDQVDVYYARLPLPQF